MYRAEYVAGTRTEPPHGKKLGLSDKIMKTSEHTAEVTALVVVTQLPGVSNEIHPHMTCPCWFFPKGLNYGQNVTMLALQKSKRCLTPKVVSCVQKDHASLIRGQLP